ncbi:MAG: hypothetical protein ABS46_12050 [Cytophagaceae bacterium SCN 52-12]|nr:MAG: hypothetical protein ABS46_12050 [Cytophagaceae bacterium SCN 52-12]
MLPEYTPPVRIWEAVAKRLDGTGIYDLPEHTPGAEIWDAIEARLENRTGRSRYLSWLSAAAAAAVFCIAGFLSFFDEERAAVRVTQEKLDERLQISVVSEVDSQYDEFMEICLAQAEICRKPDFSRLRQEFEILKQATSDLRDAAGPFNKDRVLVEEHASLELRKAEILNEMVKFI